jgi:hypothetical protein
MALGVCGRPAGCVVTDAASQTATTNTVTINFDPN